jgi:hypothetical protein
MTQITTRVIADDAVNDAKIKLRNNQSIRARNNANTADVSLLKVNASDFAEFGVKPQSSFTPSGSNDLVNYSTLQSYVAGMRDLKDAVRACATASINLASMPASLDGVTLNSGERFAVIKQTNAYENGIYIFNGTGATATRATDMDTSVEVTQGVSFDIVEGTVYGNKRVLLTTPDTIILGTTNLTFVVVPNGPTVKLSKLEQLTLISGDITNQYINLQNTALYPSVQVFFSGVLQKQGTDYTLSDVSSVTRITFAGQLASAGAIALVAGDTLEVYYETLG